MKRHPLLVASAVVIALLSGCSTERTLGRVESGGHDGGRGTPANALVHYDFSEGIGAMVLDRSGSTPSIDLEVEDPSRVTWTAGGLRIDEPTRVVSFENDIKIAASLPYSQTKSPSRHGSPHKIPLGAAPRESSR